MTKYKVDGFTIDAANIAEARKLAANKARTLVMAVTSPTPTPTPTPIPTPDPPPSPSIALDPCTNPDPLSLWRGVYAQRRDGTAPTGAQTSLADVAPGRIEHSPDGGPGGGPFRRLTVVKGDNVFGARCSIGNNEWRSAGTGGSRGTFITYREGDERTTTLVLRLAPTFPYDSSIWQHVFQMKQAQPSSSGGGTPALSFAVYQGRLLQLFNGQYSGGLDCGPVPRDRWFEVAISAHYAQSNGWIRVSVDRTKVGERSGCVTLKREALAGGPIPQGQSIPSALHFGIYHDDSLPTTYVDLAEARVS